MTRRKRKQEPDPTLEELAAHYGVDLETMRRTMIYAREVGCALAEHAKITDEDRAELGRLLAETASRP
jgi:CBS-domain-containing membrane protein